MAIGSEPSPYLAVFRVGRVVLNEQGSLPSIAARQLFQESEVRGSMEDGLFPVMNAGLPQFNRSKNLHGLALPGHGNFGGTTDPAPGGVQGSILAKAGFVAEEQRPVLLLRFFWAGISVPLPAILLVSVGRGQHATRALHREARTME